MARRYAKALLIIGQEDGNYELYGKEMGEFAALMGQTALAETLVNPLYPLAVREKVLTQVLDRISPSPMVKNLIVLLMEKSRIGLTEAISEYYLKLVDSINNVERATITAAFDLPEDIMGQVRTSLEGLTGKTIILDVEQDASIIGGIIAQVGDLTLDGSVKTQLENLKESLIKG